MNYHYILVIASGMGGGLLGNLAGAWFRGMRQGARAWPDICDICGKPVVLRITPSWTDSITGETHLSEITACSDHTAEAIARARDWFDFTENGEKS
jgi:hypothetical protein